MTWVLLLMTGLSSQQVGSFSDRDKCIEFARQVYEQGMYIMHEGTKPIVHELACLPTSFPSLGITAPNNWTFVNPATPVPLDNIK